MLRTLYLPLLMLLTYDFHRDRVAEAEPVRVNAALVSLDHDRNHRTETRGEPEGWDENSAELVGKWRNNGEALEPKWRDGDSIPLLPFSEISRYSSGKIDDSREEVRPGFQRDTKDERKRNQDDSLRSRKTDLSSSSYEDDEPMESNDGYRERDETLARKRNRPWPGQNSAAFEKTSNRKKEPNEDHKDDQEATWYRKTFQEKQQDYGYEISDEEYSKPKPRKRRPPQNYEFALNDDETSLRTVERVEESSGSSNQDKRKESSLESTKKDSQNAMELKSLLKMQQKEGSSLSEILQRRNLTLLDLLRGKTDAINALKMKDVEENENSNDEAAETAADSFAKVSTTRETEHSQKDVEIVVPIGTGNLVLRKNQGNARASSSSGSRNGEAYSEGETATSGKSMISSNVDLVRGETVVTTPMPVATNSMEVLRGDEATAKLRSGGEIRMDDLDEDEIMEFSDFTDYKKGRSGVSPVWLMMKEEGGGKESLVENSEGHLEDKGSTLSIEKILRPTERSKSANNASVQSMPGKELDIKSEKLTDGEQRVIVQNFADDYGIFSEKEYQDDAPRLYDLDVGTETSESDGKISAAQEMKSGLATASPDTNFTVESEQSDLKNPIMENNNSLVAKNHQSNGTTEKNSYGDVINEGEPEARAEIFELFASGSAGKRLERLLKSRNMSLEELIALRQRGSSKVHLAEVSRIKVQKSDDESRSNMKATLVSKDETQPSLSRAIANSDENYNNSLHNYLSQTTENVVNLDSSSNLANAVQVEESTTEQLLSHLESEMSNENLKSNEREELRERQRTVQIVDLLTTFGSLSFAKDLQRNFAGERSEEELKDLPAQSNNFGAVLANNVVETIGINDTGFVKEVAKKDPNSLNVQTEYNILGDEESNTENGKALSKVKPSIIASGAILGVTLVVFLAIFIVCKIQQKQKYRYRSTFSRAVFQGPVMAARKLSNSSSLSNVMVNVVATSTAKRPERNEIPEPTTDIDSKTDIDNDSLDANDSWETIPDYMK